jgi:hypothetical protein
VSDPKSVGAALDALKQIVPLVEPLGVADRRWLIEYLARTALPAPPQPDAVSPAPAERCARCAHADLGGVHDPSWPGCGGSAAAYREE